MNVTRTARPDIQSVSSIGITYHLSKGQRFYETPKAYEIWQEKPLRFIKRLPKFRVFWVIQYDSIEGQDRNNYTDTQDRENYTVDEETA